MDKIVVDVLEKIEDNDFICYLIGGYVRDSLLNNNNYDIDICTNARPEDLSKIFNINSYNKYGSINFKFGNYKFDITTFRKEIKYERGKLLEYEFIDDFREDIKRRDFTINAIALDKNNNVIDLLNGVNDLRNKKIKLIGDKNKLVEDPLRIIRAIRLSVVLNFELDKELEKYISECKKYLKNVSLIKLKQELEKILRSTNFEKGLSLFKKYNLINELGIKYDNINYIDNVYGMWAQLELKRKYPFNKKEYKKINDIREVITQGRISNDTLFKYGININLLAAKILKIDEELVKKMYNNLVVKNINELAIDIVEINSVINDFDKSRVIRDMLIRKVNDRKINNCKKDLLKQVREEKI